MTKRLVDGLDFYAESICPTGISGLDDITQDGPPCGRQVLVRRSRLIGALTNEARVLFGLDLRPQDEN